MILTHLVQSLHFMRPFLIVVFYPSCICVCTSEDVCNAMYMCVTILCVSIIEVMKIYLLRVITIHFYNLNSVKTNSN